MIHTPVIPREAKPKTGDQAASAEFKRLITHLRLDAWRAKHQSLCGMTE